MCSFNSFRLHKDRAMKDAVQQMCTRDECSLLGTQAVSSPRVNLAPCTPHWVLFAFWLMAPNILHWMKHCHSSQCCFIKWRTAERHNADVICCPADVAIFYLFLCLSSLQPVLFLEPEGDIDAQWDNCLVKSSKPTWAELDGILNSLALYVCVCIVCTYAYVCACVFKISAKQK